MGNSVKKNSLKTYLPHKLFRRDKECYLIEEIDTSLIQKRLSHSYQSKHHMCFYDFFVTQDYYSCVSVTVDLVLQY